MQRLKSHIKIALIIVAVVVSILAICCIVYKVGIGKVSNNDDKKEIIINPGNSYLTIGSLLKENDLIKSELFYKIYIKLNNPTPVQAGKYYLSENMNVKEIVKSLSKGSTYNPDVISITFKEGINMRHIAQLIAQETDNTEDDVFSLLTDESYLDELISEYWFISDEIKNKNIYYSLEGYLFPDTYEFKNKKVTVKEIFKVMLDQMGKKLTSYKTNIDASKYSIHELLTLSSIVELEASNSDDRNGVAGVFYNRLESKWALGSDVTTYYGIKVDMSERDLYISELNTYNSYNTRHSKMAGKLPVSPICIPSIKSIEAVLNPAEHNYYFFVADKNKKTYFSKTSSEHNKTISTLKEKDLWFQY